MFLPNVVKFNNLFFLVYNSAGQQSLKVNTVRISIIVAILEEK